MRPLIKPALQLSWGVFLGVAIACAIFLALWYDWGESAAQVEEAALAYARREGSLDLEQQVAIQAQANADLASHVEELKEQTGVREVVPFVVPDGYASSPEYFRVVFGKVREDLLQRASIRGSEGYEQDLGFAFLRGQLPDAAQVERWLLMLQLTTKAVYLALSSPHNTLHNIQITDLGAAFEPVLTGPEGRPPLLREYRFQLQVDGSLHDILWLLHQLSAETQTEAHRDMQRWLSGPDGVASKVYQALFQRQVAPPSAQPAVSPLVVLGLDIDSENLDPSQQVQTLRASFSLAGMEFLEPSERGEQLIPAGSGGVAAGAAGGRRVARP